MEISCRRLRSTNNRYLEKGIKIYGVRSEAIIVLLVGLVTSGLGKADVYQLESCQFIAESTDSANNSVPPGLDEPLNCDHKCFYEELGLDLLSDEEPNLHDMYSIGWRLVEIERTQFDENLVWTVYLERKSDQQRNECEEIHAPRSPNDEGTKPSS